MATRAVLLALLSVSSVLAFSNTVPFLAWSSSQSLGVLDNLVHGTHPKRHALLESIISNGDICSYDVIVVVDHPGVRSSDLRALQPSCRLAALIRNSSSSLQLPHIERNMGSSQAVSLFTTRCGTNAIDVVPGSGEWELDIEKNSVLSVSLPRVEGSSRYRKIAMAEHERLLSKELDKLAHFSPNHLVIYTGSDILLERRESPLLSAFDSPPDPVIPSTTVLSPKGGILHSYQLLTPALITSLLLVFFILVPIIMIGISALASIQSTLRSEAPKDYNAQEKKVQ